MQKDKRKLNQSGMTLIELVVVILIVGILSAGATVGISYVSRMNSTSAGEKLASLLERTRVYTLSANGTVKLVLKEESGIYYGVLMNGSTEVDKVGLGNGSLKLNVKQAGAADGDPDVVTTISSSTSYEIKYNKANGAFEEKYKQIEIVGNETRYVKLVHTTGRSYLE